MGIVNYFKLKFDKQYIEQTLDTHIKSFFPDNGLYSESCLYKGKKLTKEFLPCNLRNSDWLAKMYQIELKQKGISVPLSAVKNYIETSKMFNMLRHEYQLKIIYSQLDWHGGNINNLTLPSKYMNIDLYLNKDVDEVFREAVVATLSVVGLDLEVIEQGIEKHPEQWRNKFMEAAFNNRYEKCFDFINGNVMPSADPSHKENWLKARLYEYYQKHKASVDKYGVLTPEMKMSEKEYKSLMEILKVQNAQREKQMTDWKEMIAKQRKLNTKAQQKEIAEESSLEK